MTLTTALHGKTEHDEIIVDIDVSTYRGDFDIDGFNVVECVEGPTLSDDEVYRLYEDEIWDYVMKNAPDVYEDLRSDWADRFYHEKKVELGR